MGAARFVVEMSPLCNVVRYKDPWAGLKTGSSITPSYALLEVWFYQCIVVPEPAGPAQSQGSLQDHSFLLMWPCCFEACHQCFHIMLTGKSGVPGRSLSARSDLLCTLSVCLVKMPPVCWAVEVMRGCLASDWKADSRVKFSVQAIWFRSANQLPVHLSSREAHFCEKQ